MKVRVRLDLMGLYYDLDDMHPTDVMKMHGLRYEKSVPSPISDGWIFEGVEDSLLPSPMPDYMSEIP